MSRIASGALPTNAAMLARGVLKSMLLSKLKFAVLVLLASSVACGGAALSARGLEVNANGGQQVDKPPSPSRTDGSRASGADHSKAAEPSSRSAGDSKVQSLLKERLAALREIVVH
jgi:hypothetical protein